jgi:hypothetical protein
VIDFVCVCCIYFFVQGYALVEFAEKEEAEAAQKGMNDEGLLLIPCYFSCKFNIFLQKCLERN